MSPLTSKRLQKTSGSVLSHALGACTGGIYTLGALFVASGTALAQIPTNSSDRPLNLPANSPFIDPDIIYLEADELVDEQDEGTLTAIGEVEGRYQDRTLRADKVIYNLETGDLIASGNVVLVDGTGAVQFAEKLEVSSELEAGTASNFSTQFKEGGRLAARFVTRGSADGGVELYNAYYTACEACKKADGSPERPTWRIRARRVTQNPEQNSIFYRDAVIEIKGIPVLYTPFLAHPDPSAGRASGFLTPFGGISGSKGVAIEAPYFFALDDYTNLTVTPHFFSGVNPLLEYDLERRFFSGAVKVNGSFAYDYWFDSDGNNFDDPAQFANPLTAPTGRELRSHFFANGLFDIKKDWEWGFQVQAATDDLYLNRYNLQENPLSFGLHTADSRRLVSQAFILGQDSDFRFSTSAFGFQSLRTSVLENGTTGLLSVIEEDSARLPIVAPRVQFERYFEDPILGGRLKGYADGTYLTREIGTDYGRATAGLDWSKSWIAPAGVEVQPFAKGRVDYIDLVPEDQDNIGFARSLGQVGADIRWPFIKSGNTVDWIIEPRAQITQSFGDGKLENFETTINGTPTSLFQDSQDVDLDHALFWSENKATGYDFWQKGFRADVGASLSADWDKNRAQLFLGQSYSSETDVSFDAGSGLEDDTSDLIGLFELQLGRSFSTTTRVRFDDDEAKFRRIDSSARYSNKYFAVNARYYNINNNTFQNSTLVDVPTEEVSGSVRAYLSKNWSLSYGANRNLNTDVMSRQRVSLSYRDDCTLLEVFYNENVNSLGVVGNERGIGVRVSLLTLGNFGD